MMMFFRGFYRIVCSASAAQRQYEHHHVHHISVLACLLLISQAKLKVFVISVGAEIHVERTMYLISGELITVSIFYTEVLQTMINMNMHVSFRLCSVHTMGNVSK